MTKKDFIKKEGRAIDPVNCSNADVVSHILKIQKDREVPGVTYDFKDHIKGWQILSVDKINENVPVCHITGEMLFKDPDDFREPIHENGDLLQVSDEAGKLMLFMLLDFEFIGEQKVQFQSIAVAVNPQTTKTPEKPEEGGKDGN